jgi:hypothetical protein
MEDFDAIVKSWLPFVFAMNSISRAIGLRDIYPFILSWVVIGKLAFIHGILQHARIGGDRGNSGLDRRAVG